MAAAEVDMAAQNLTLASGVENFNNMQPYTWPDLVFSIRCMLYLWSPNETMFKTYQEVPNLFTRTVIYSPILVITEILGLWASSKSLPRWNHALVSCCTFLMVFLPTSILGNFEFAWFSTLYDKYRVVDLAWDSPWTWILCFFSADLGAYLWHRAAHEVNFVWAFHAVHHSADELNLFAAYRLPSFNRQIAVLFWMPMAFVFPSGIFYFHYQMNYIYQLWIHTNLIEGPDWMGWFLITPRLHRVHHARNRYCIDKNYGSVLSIWDRIFGTFEPYREDVPLSYGLVSRWQSFDVISVQFLYMRGIWDRALTYDNPGDRASAFLKGPGWSPGKPRLGVYEDIPEVYDDKPYDKKNPNWCYAYLTWNVVIAFLLFGTLNFTLQTMGRGVGLLHAGYLLWLIANIGYFLERKTWVPLAEVVRCASYFMVEALLWPALSTSTSDTVLSLYRYTAILSMLLWSFNMNMYGAEPKKID